MVTCSSACDTSGRPAKISTSSAELGDLEGAADRPVEQVARHHVDEREHHHAEQQDRGGDAERGVGAPFPDRARRRRHRRKGAVRSAPILVDLAQDYLPAATFFSSAWNSSRTALALMPLALACLIHSSMIGAGALLRLGLPSPGVAVTIVAAGASAARRRPTLSARVPGLAVAARGVLAGVLLDDRLVLLRRACSTCPRS